MPKSSSRRARSKQTAKSLPPRLPAIDVTSLTAEQEALVEAIKSGPRGHFSNDGPFAVYLHAPGFGQLAQQLGAHMRFGTTLPPRLSELAILFTAQYWKAQYEWAAHAVIAAKRGVTAATIRDLQAGRAPKSAPRDEMAVYNFAKELYATRRVSNATYARVHKLLGDAGMVELVGILGYYVTVSMALNVFCMPAPEDTPPPFREPAVK
jgi:4-carboxymuconolactone decarboxylase